MYRERPSTVAGATAWESVVDEPESVILPDGCMDLIWHDGALFIAGPDTAAHPFNAEPGTRMVAVRFAPGTAPAILGVAAHEVRDQRVDLAAVWTDAATRRLADQVAVDGAAAIERIALRRLTDVEVAPVIPTIVDLANANAPVAAIAEHVGLGERQLHRRCLDAFGYGAKTLTRIMRMRRALASATAGTPLAETAATTGYADQAHLARDVRALTGRTLTALRG